MIAEGDPDEVLTDPRVIASYLGDDARGGRPIRCRRITGAEQRRGNHQRGHTRRWGMKVQTPDGGSPGRGRSILRKWGPFGAIVVVLALVGAFAAVNAGDDDSEEAGGGGSSTTAATSSGLPDGVVTYQARQGRAEPRTRSSGESAATRRPGVFAVAVVRRAAVRRPVHGGQRGRNGRRGHEGLDQGRAVRPAGERSRSCSSSTARSGNDDTPEDTWQTYLGYNRMLATYTETYGRRVELVRYNADRQHPGLGRRNRRRRDDRP